MGNGDDLKSDAEGEALGFGKSTKSGKQYRYYAFLFNTEDD